MLKKLLAISTFFTLFLTIAAFAQERVVQIDDQGPAKKIIKIEKNLPPSLLNLTDEQRKAFKKLDLDLQKEILPMRNESDVKQLELEAEKTEDQPDLKKIYALIDDIHRLQASIEKKSVAADLQKRSLLDDKQRKIWDTDGPFGRKFLMLTNPFDDDKFMRFNDEFLQKWGKKLPEDDGENIEREIEIR
jgi:Spy/CpxP family protein refolding chaperone